MLRDIFERESLYTEERPALMLRGLTRTFTKEKNRFIIDDVRNFLFLSRETRVLVDLLALNLQRGRDHGLPDFRTMRKALGIDDFEDFEFTSDTETQDKIAEAYDHDNDQIDPFIGIINEDPIDDDALMGPTGVEIIAEGFQQIRDGDSLWYERRGVIGKRLRREIECTTLKTIIARNTDIDFDELPDDVFFVR